MLKAYKNCYALQTFSPHLFMGPPCDIFKLGCYLKSALGSLDPEISLICLRQLLWHGRMWFYMADILSSFKMS
jgi:hypothetical protein